MCDACVCDVCVCYVCVVSTGWMRCSDWSTRQLYNHSKWVQYMCTHSLGQNIVINISGILAWALALHGSLTPAISGPAFLCKYRKLNHQVGFWKIGSSENNDRSVIAEFKLKIFVSKMTIWRISKTWKIIKMVVILERVLNCKYCTGPLVQAKLFRWS